MPAWALRRVESVLQAQPAGSPPDPADLARLAGVSRSLARRCLAAHRQPPTGAGTG